MASQERLIASRLPATIIALPSTDLNPPESQQYRAAIMPVHDTRPETNGEKIEHRP